VFCTLGPVNIGRPATVSATVVATTYH